MKVFTRGVREKLFDDFDKGIYERLFNIAEREIIKKMHQGIVYVDGTGREATIPYLYATFDAHGKGTGFWIYSNEYKHQVKDQSEIEAVHSLLKKNLFGLKKEVRIPREEAEWQSVLGTIPQKGEKLFLNPLLVYKLVSDYQTREEGKKDNGK